MDMLMSASHADDRLIAVVSQPEKPAGRGRQVRRNPVASRVPSGVELLEPTNVNAEEFLEKLRRLAPDLVVVTAYGQILKPVLLALPKLGCVNVHASLLPMYRGAAPAQWAIARGDPFTGVSTMFMNEKMDEGDVILQDAVAIEPDDTGGTLLGRLAVKGAELLVKTLDLIRKGNAPRVKQDASKATYAPKLGKGDGRIDWTLPASVICNRVRAFNPWPCCWCETPPGSGRTLKILRADAGNIAVASRPGDMVEWSGEGPLVAAGGGTAVRLVEIQPEGKKPMSGRAYVCGHQPLERMG